MGPTKLDKKVLNILNEMHVHYPSHAFVQLEKEEVKGGKADNKTLEDIANKHDVDITDIEKEFQVGIKVEMEHTDDEKIAEEIAKDHIFENPKYYSLLIQAKLADEKDAIELYDLLLNPDTKTIKEATDLYNLMLENIGNEYEDLIKVKDIFKNDYVQLTEYETSLDNFYEQPGDCSNKIKELKSYQIKNYDKIYPTQGFIQKSKLNKIKKYKKIDLPFIIKENDKYFVIDGHHRLADMLLNKKPVYAKIYKG